VQLLLRVGGDEGEDAEVRRRAIESVGYAEDRNVRTLIESAVASGDRVLCAGALRAMGNSADTRWGSEVLEWLDELDRDLCWEALHAAGALGLRAGVPQLAALAESEDRDIQKEAIWALGEIGGARAKRALKVLAADLADDEALADAVDEALATLALSEGVIDFEVFDGEPDGGRAGAGRGALDLDDDDDASPWDNLDWGDDDDLADDDDLEDVGDLEDMGDLEDLEDVDDDVRS
jgi:HEAT repeat protein